MPCLLWDASALVKRNAPEVGTEVVETLFELPNVSMAITYSGYAEVCAVLRRKHNRDTIDKATFQTARQAVEQEILLAPAVDLVTIDDADMLTGIGLTDKHHINSADAAILSAFLRYIPQSPSTCLVVSADQLLLRAAKVEGILTLNPETMANSSLPLFPQNLP